MEIDPGATAAVDEVLTTTRAVRRRLDLERDVDDEIILDCIDIAEQAPTGGNQGSRRWLIVRDPELKQRLAQLYRDVIGNRMIEARDRGPSGLDGIIEARPDLEPRIVARRIVEHWANMQRVVDGIKAQFEQPPEGS